MSSRLRQLLDAHKNGYGINVEHGRDIPLLCERVLKLEYACAKQNEEVCQSLGAALGYPWFKDDQKNFPGSTEEHGVCVGEHVAETIAAEAARRIRELRAELERPARDG